MSIESAVLLRRVARSAGLVLIVGLLLSGAAQAQLPISPPPPPIGVTAGSVIPFSHGSTGLWGQVYNIAQAPNGYIAFMDSAASAIYQLAPGESVPTLMVGPSQGQTNSNGSTMEAVGTYWNAAVAFDKNNVLYVTDRYGSNVTFYRVPFTPPTATTPGGWIFSTSSNWLTAPEVLYAGATSPSPIKPQYLAIGDDQTFYVSWTNTGEIDKFTVNSSGAATNVVQIVTGLDAYASQVAVDHAGNVYFIEDATGGGSGRANGVFEIPANAKLPIVGASDGAIEKTLTQVIPPGAGFLGIKGLTFDIAGNLYVTSQNNAGEGGNVAGVWMIPNEGTPKAPNLVWDDTVQISPVSAQFPVLVDPRGFLWIPTGGSTNWTTPGTADATCSATTTAACTASSVVLWAMGSANLGASPVGSMGPTQTIYYNFTEATTPASFVFSGEGAANFTATTTNPRLDTTVTPAVPPCTAGTTYPAFSGTETDNQEYSWCTFWVQLNATQVGEVSGELEMLDSKGNVIPGSNVYLSGVGEGASVSILAPNVAAQPIASGLNEPQQLAVDYLGNSYVADSALKAIEMYPPGKLTTLGTAIGTGLKAPTGVAVDGAGDVYIGDSGDIIEIPYVVANGVGALARSEQTTILTGLGNQLQLAADGAGDVFAADMSNKQVVKIANPQVNLLLQGEPLNTLGVANFPLFPGFTSPSAIASDNSGNVWLADGKDLWEITPFGDAIEVTSSLLPPVTGLAVDPSGSIFIAQSNGLSWIPYQASSGGIDVNGIVQISTTPALPSNPTGVALDGNQNVYVSYGTGSSAAVSQLGPTGDIDFGTIVPFAESDEAAGIFNLGNEPLTLSALSGDVFTAAAGTNAADYGVGSANAPACNPASPAPSGTFCNLDIALTPSVAGPSGATLAILSNAVNAPSVNLALSADAVPDPRQATTTTVAITPGTITYPGAGTITVTTTTQAGGTGTPSGTITLKINGSEGNSYEESLPLSSSGVATYSFSKLIGGTYNVVADYGGAGAAGTPPNFAASGVKTTFVVQKAAPTLAALAIVGASDQLTVWAGSTFVQTGSPDTITASVTSSVGTPTGTVSFLQNGSVVDPKQATLALNSSGDATFSTADLPAGVYNLTVAYTGDNNYASANFTYPTFQVISQNITSVEITGTPATATSAPAATLTVTAGTPGMYNLSLEPLVGYNGTVYMQCVNATLPPYSECSFAYASGQNLQVSLGNAATSNIVVTISTNVPVNGGTTARLTRQAPPWSLAGIFGLGLVGLIGGRKRFNRYLTMICLGLMLSGAFMGITACTNAGYSTPPQAPKVKTPAGTYPIQIITVNPNDGLQNSLTTPVFTLTTTVQ